MDSVKRRAAAGGGAHGHPTLALPLLLPRASLPASLAWPSFCIYLPHLHTGAATLCGHPSFPPGARTRLPRSPFPLSYPPCMRLASPAYPVDPGLVVIGNSVSHCVRH